MSRSSRRFSALRIRQPIGEFFLAVMQAPDLVAISYADVRRLQQNKLDRYIGINRRLTSTRVTQLKSYVNTYDATFPTSIILAIDSENATYDEVSGVLQLFANKGKNIEDIAKIIDGQHRIAGLGGLSDNKDFEVGVAVFVGADIATQANIFATVNLAQTKVNRSLAYDLLDYEKARSPQKTAHYIAVALDQVTWSPLYHRIKRLGRATEGRMGETITQAVVVEMLLTLVTKDAMLDRDALFRKGKIERPTYEELRDLPFRGLFADKQDKDIAQIVLNLFVAVQDRWPSSWDDRDRPGNTLPKTNGFRALMRFLKIAYINIVGISIGDIPKKAKFREILDRVDLRDADFNIDTFPPGTGGEAKFFKYLEDALAPR